VVAQVVAQVIAQCGCAEASGHAAPVDTGSTAQRYAVPYDRSNEGLHTPVKPGYIKTTHPPVDNRLIHRSADC
jgi:hypothetical protein